MDKKERMIEKEDEINVGDEIKVEELTKLPVVVIDKYFDEYSIDPGYRYYVICKDGAIMIADDMQSIKKTGRYFPHIRNMLDAMNAL